MPSNRPVLEEPIGYADNCTCERCREWTEHLQRQRAAENGESLVGRWVTPAEVSFSSFINSPGSEPPSGDELERLIATIDRDAEGSAPVRRDYAIDASRLRAIVAELIDLRARYGGGEPCYLRTPAPARRAGLYVTREEILGLWDEVLEGRARYFVISRDWIQNIVEQIADGSRSAPPPRVHPAMLRLTAQGGCIKSAADCTTQEVDEARDAERYFEDEAGRGYVVLEA